MKAQGKPHNLEAFAKEANLSEEAIRSLAGLPTRSRKPKLESVEL